MVSRGMSGLLNLMVYSMLLSFRLLKTMATENTTLQVNIHVGHRGCNACGRGEECNACGHGECNGQPIVVLSLP